jgi:hypothetical protein
MKSVSICHAPEDRERAHELARFIGVNFGFEVSLDDAEMAPDRDILAAAERALSASIAIVMLSPASVPAPLQRAGWENVFNKAPAEYETPIAFVLLAECPFPDVLRRQRFFDLSRDWLAGARTLKRWMMSLERQTPAPPQQIHAPQMESGPLAALWPVLVDQPGSVAEVDSATAETLAHEARDDFEAVFRVRCAGRPLAVILGELGRVLRFTLPGPVEENRRGLAWHCAAHRYLMILEGAQENLREALQFGGRTSTVHAVLRDLPTPPPVDDISISNIAEAMDYALALLPRDAEAGGRLGARIAFVLSEYDRYAEADLVLETMERSGSFRTEWVERERAWIHHRWDESVEIPDVPPTDAVQLDLFGDGEWLGL